MDKIKLTGRNIAYRINSTCENIIMPVNKDTKTEIPILKINRNTTVPKRLIVFVTLKLTLSLSSISSITTFSLSSVSGLADSNSSIRSAPKDSISDSPYCKSSHGCFTCTENRLSRIKATLSFPLLSESGSTIFVPSDRAALLMSAENPLTFAI